MVGQDLDSLGGVVLVMKLSSVIMSKRAKREKLKMKTTCSLTKHEIWGKRLHPFSSVPERTEPGPGLPSAWRVR